MEVRLIAQTQLNDNNFPAWFYETPLVEREEGLSTIEGDQDFLVEFAGRLCYRSFNLPNPVTKKNKDYLNRTLWEQQHWSIAEHASYTFLLEGVSRSFLAELTRHRHLSFSVESQRFIDYSDVDWVNPPAMADLDIDINNEIYVDINFSRETILDSGHTLKDLIRTAYISMYELLRENGLSRKQAREAARSVLPNASSVSMVVSGNARAWRDVLQKRIADGADREIRLVCEKIKEILKETSPNIFQNL